MPNAFLPIATHTLERARDWAARAWGELPDPAGKPDEPKKDPKALEDKFIQESLNAMAQLPGPAARLFFMLEAGSALSRMAKASSGLGPGRPMSAPAQLAKLASLSAHMPILGVGPMVFFLGYEDGLGWISEIGEKTQAPAVIKKAKLLEPYASEDCFYAFAHSLSPHGFAREREAKRLGDELGSSLASHGFADTWALWKDLAAVDAQCAALLDAPAAEIMERVATRFRLDSAKQGIHEARNGRLGLGLKILQNTPHGTQADFVAEQAIDMGKALEDFIPLAGWKESDCAEELRAKAASAKASGAAVFLGMALRNPSEESSPMMAIFEPMASGSRERCLASLLDPAGMHGALKAKFSAPMALAWMEEMLLQAKLQEFSNPCVVDALRDHAHGALDAAMSLMAAIDLRGLLPLKTPRPKPSGRSAL